MRDEATNRQIAAADPRASTWVSANAGSGKTRVLTDRVARLLLDGVDPKNILCLTYTKAAASEMQNRLFKRLGSWAMMDDARLSAELRDMGAGDGFGSDTLRQARRLFARAIEVPGGLRIQTIHSFCSSILRRFPLEAGVSPQFTEMEDRASELLRMEVLDTLSDGPKSDLIDNVSRYVHDQQLLKLAKEVIQHKSHFAAPITHDELAKMFGVPAGMTVRSLLDDAFDDKDRKTIEATVKACFTGKSTDIKAATTLQDFSASGPVTFADQVLMEGLLLTGKSAKEPFTAKVGKFPTKDLRAKHEALGGELDDLMERVQEVRPKRIAIAAMQKAIALHDFARLFIPAYEEQKLLRGLLDFDDLIAKTNELLTQRDKAAWVLFKLDGGIDHILVDEAQDTSPEQWQVIDALSREFTAGEGARSDRPRTIFVVGDKKQSIYSFQGADPEEFDRKRDYFGETLKETPTPLRTTELQHSFRSSSAILSLVDQTFTGERAEGLEAKVSHIAFKDVLPGRVDVWPMIEPPEKEEPGEWYDPVDKVKETDTEVQLARQIADEIKRMLEYETIPTDGEERGTFVRRPVRPGDILILVQRRKELFREIIRACKDSGLPIAGADRLTLTEQLAVKDILALLSFLALAEDDLSLAAALKSPLFGWTEQDLYSIAQGRERVLTDKDGKEKKTVDDLWRVLRGKANRYPDTLAILNDLRGQADFLRPYDLISRILVRHDGRRKLVGQLGAEAEDAIDALLAQALAYERSSTPSLTGFLHWMDAEEIVVKRQMDSASDEIRVMTVHGSKGLEAPIVILPETAGRRNEVKDEVIRTEDGPFWKMSRDETPQDLVGHYEQMQDATARERRRLLYVAMTRAEKWLVVFGASNSVKDPEMWHGLISDAMGHVGATPISIIGQSVSRYQMHDWDGLPLVDGERPQPPVFTAPDLPIVDAPTARKKTLSPSDLGGAKALPAEFIDDDEETAKARGRLIHLLLEHLPQYEADERWEIAETLINADTDTAHIADRHIFAEDVIAMLDDPAFAHLFAGPVLAEVEVTADLPELEGERIHGTIDRLVVSENTVLCVDYKSNRAIPDSPQAVPDGIKRQLGAYLSALRQIYPGYEVKTAILWTAGPLLMEMPDDLVMAALHRCAIA
ncbi:double-strand break repair helicase AddA [Marivivens donghaensis]|uniref:DNA 3'-5' helicase n=1 Tax=Marivivens donghaensis TaxID=1699413 RepID=A0ABX0VU58_9RHOB|nr:double-strand break repair helicase AddA [Marivivens donghaensis]NIY71426.1 double-strand break repair helicase AddA [Marivivens donghaensis]